MNYYNRRRKRNLIQRRNFSITVWLILANILAFIIEIILILISEDNFTLIALKPSSILQGDYLWTLVTHMFIHAPGNLIIFFSLHLLVNMFVLFSLGSLCERIIGRKRFLWFYLISGLFAGILSVLLAGFFGNTDLGARIFGSPEIFMVGASGAIFAIAGLYMILLPKLKFMIIFLPFFTLPAYVMIPLALFGLWIASIIFNLPFGNVAHFGGFLSGVVYGSYLRTKYKKKVMRLQRMIR